MDINVKSLLIISSCNKNDHYKLAIKASVDAQSAP